MTRIRRSGYQFVMWVGDHPPRHVHVYRDDVLIAKWNLELDVEEFGIASAKVRRLILRLRCEGLL